MLPTRAAEVQTHQTSIISHMMSTIKHEGKPAWDENFLNDIYNNLNINNIPTMSASRIFYQFARPSRPLSNAIRTFNTTAVRSKDLNERANASAPIHREDQKTKPLNPHLTNTTSTNTTDFPNVGARKAPPDLLRDVDPDYAPTDPVPGNVEHMTGGTLRSSSASGTSSSGAAKPELEVGELEDVTFKVEPLKREGEDMSTLKARLLCSYTP